MTMTTKHLTEQGWIADDPSNHMVFNKLVSFLDSMSSDPTNAGQLVASATDALSSTGTSAPSVEQYRSESRFLLAVLLTIVQQLEPTAAEQDYLIKLVLSLRETPVPESVLQTMDPYAMDSDNMNRDLNNFINVWSSIGTDAPFHPPLESRGGHVELDKVRPPWRQDPGHYLSAESWASLSAFLARLHVAAPDLLKLDLRGLFAMIEALEQPLSPAELEEPYLRRLTGSYMLGKSSNITTSRMPFTNLTAAQSGCLGARVFCGREGMLSILLGGSSGCNASKQSRSERRMGKLCVISPCEHLRLARRAMASAERDGGCIVVRV